MRVRHYLRHSRPHEITNERNDERDNNADTKRRTQIFVILLIILGYWINLQIIKKIKNKVVKRRHYNSDEHDSLRIHQNWHSRAERPSLYYAKVIYLIDEPTIKQER